jgi:hypothetical protein
MYLIEAPTSIADRYEKKFSPEIQQAVQNHFLAIFGPPNEIVYEKWVITFQASARVQEELKSRVDQIQIHMLRDFILKEVLPTISQWRAHPNTATTALPTDRWLLGLIDQFKRSGLISG